MTHDIIVLLAVLGVAGQVLAALLLLVGTAALLGLRAPLLALRSAVEGYELWLVFLVSAIATGGSLFFSETAGFVPCELCWYQRICMYPLAIVTLLAALADDRRAARYLLPLSVVGAGVSVYHVLVENGVVKQSQICLLSAPGGCATKWLFKGIPQHGNVLGSPKAPVTTIEYIDLQCSACRAFETEIMPSVIPNYVRSGKVRVEARPIVAIGPDSELGVRGVLAAARQNRLFNFAQILYYYQGPENGGWLTDGTVQDAAASIPGLDVPAFLQAKDSAAVRAQAKRFGDEANADGVSGTPTLYVGKTGGKLNEVTPGLVPSVAQPSAALDRALG